ncbi:MAG: hypothetical protein J3R72DRAFT_60362 [Linnemannia gamsii]|nr:MAG: hypothetical protein J3R72DRAFT_60362 [Linnemannia gamsii]
MDTYQLALTENVLPTVMFIPLRTHHKSMAGQSCPPMPKDLIAVNRLFQHSALTPFLLASCAFPTDRIQTYMDMLNHEHGLGESSPHEKNCPHEKNSPQRIYPLPGLPGHFRFTRVTGTFLGLISTAPASLTGTGDIYIWTHINKRSPFHKLNRNLKALSSTMQSIQNEGPEQRRWACSSGKGTMTSIHIVEQDWSGSWIKSL